MSVPIFYLNSIFIFKFYFFPFKFLFSTFFSLMFWTNWNEQAPSIMRASLSGANVIVIIGSNIRTPNGLAIDHRAEKIYFSDATFDKIERCEYDGSRRFVSSSLFMSYFLCLSWERKSSWAWFLENTHYWHLVHIEFLSKIIECKLYLWLGGPKEWASPSFRFGGVRWLYLLDRLGAQSCAQS